MEDGKIFGHSRGKATFDFAPVEGQAAAMAPGQANFQKRFPEQAPGLLPSRSAPMPARSAQMLVRSAQMPATPAPMPARPAQMPATPAPEPRRPSGLPDGSGVVTGRGDGHGLKLLNSCSTVFASLGDQVIASIYILNVGLEVLQDVRLVPRQFSNADMTELAYSDFPCDEELNIGTLLPGTHRVWNCHYRVTAADVLSGGPIISSLAATAITLDGDRVRAECDLILEVRWHGEDAWDDH